MRGTRRSSTTSTTGWDARARTATYRPSGSTPRRRRLVRDLECPLQNVDELVAVVRTEVGHPGALLVGRHHLHEAEAGDGGLRREHDGSVAGAVEGRSRREGRRDLAGREGNPLRAGLTVPWVAGKAHAALVPRVPAS